MSSQRTECIFNSCLGAKKTKVTTRSFLSAYFLGSAKFMVWEFLERSLPLLPERVHVGNIDKMLELLATFTRSAAPRIYSFYDLLVWWSLLVLC